jgi:D-3-phosphoglycerate dehydrogenase
MNSRLVEEHGQLYSVDVASAPLVTPADAVANTAGADGVLVGTNPLPRAVIESMAPSVRIIGRIGVGLDAIDLRAAKDRGIAVFHAPDYCVPEVATHTVAMLLALNRQLVVGDRLARTNWLGWRAIEPISSLSEQVVGLVGFGRIARAVAARLKALVSKVIACDPYSVIDDAEVDSVTSLEELLGRSDYVSLHLPLSADTQKLIGSPELALMRPGAALINVSRGGLIDEAALVDALVSGHLSGAALDVLSEEPPDESSPLLHAPNVLLSPHAAWYSVASERRVWTMAFEGILEFLNGERLTSGRLAPLD